MFQSYRTNKQTAPHFMPALSPPSAHTATAPHPSFCAQSTARGRERLRLLEDDLLALVASPNMGGKLTLRDVCNISYMRGVVNFIGLTKGDYTCGVLCNLVWSREEKLEKMKKSRGK